MRNSAPASDFHGCVNVVGKVSTNMWLSAGLYERLARAFMSVQKVVSLYTAFKQVLQVLVRNFFEGFLSVTCKVLHALHRTNNNDKFYKSILLLFRRISS